MSRRKIIFLVCSEWRKGKKKGKEKIQSPWVKIFKVDASLRFVKPSLSLYVCWQKRGYFVRKSWLWRKRVAINILYGGCAGRGADVFLSVISFFFDFFEMEACCWLLRLAVHVFIRHKLRDMEWEEKEKVIIIKIPRENVQRALNEEKKNIKQSFFPISLTFSKKMWRKKANHRYVT